MKSPRFALTLHFVEDHEPHEGVSALPIVICIRPSSRAIVSTTAHVFSLSLERLDEPDESKDYGYAKTAWLPSENTVEVTALKPLFLVRELMELENGRVLATGHYALEATVVVSERVHEHFVRHELKARREILVAPKP